MRLCCKMLQNLEIYNLAHLLKQCIRGTVLRLGHSVPANNLFLYFNLCLSVMLDSLSSSFTSISFLTNNKQWPLTMHVVSPCIYRSTMKSSWSPDGLCNLTFECDTYCGHCLLLVRKDMDVNELERLSNITLRHRLK
jgi:hypothetical protein